jgi:hypothetical protein
VPAAISGTRIAAGFSLHEGKKENDADLRPYFADRLRPRFSAAHASHPPFFSTKFNSWLQRTSLDNA